MQEFLYESFRLAANFLNAETKNPEQISSRAKYMFMLKIWNGKNVEALGFQVKPTFENCESLYGRICPML